VNTVTVEQILSVNPQFSAGLNGASNNPGDGSATLDLRGLGSQRTLVLLNGKRLPVYDATGSVDVNQIPTALITETGLDAVRSGRSMREPVTMISLPGASGVVLAAVAGRAVGAASWARAGLASEARAMARLATPA